LISPAQRPPQAGGLGGTVMQPQRPPIQQEPTRRIEPQRIEQVNAAMPREQVHEKPPNTERMMRVAAQQQNQNQNQNQNMTVPTPQQPVPHNQPPQQPQTSALAVHDPYAIPGQLQSPIPPRPQLPSGNLDPRLILITDPDSVRASSFRVLRDGLLNKNLPRVVAISSAAQHDGKTTCAINLSLALSELTNTRVCLIDANFFAPELARVFSIERLNPIVPPESWLSPYKLVAVTPTFHVAGIVREGRARFDQHRFESMIDRLCQANYDYLIVDTPSILNTPSVTTLISGVDGTILTVRPGGTRGGDVKRAAEKIPAKKALGIALIDVR